MSASAITDLAARLPEGSMVTDPDIAGRQGA